MYGWFVDLDEMMEENYIRFRRILKEFRADRFKPNEQKCKFWLKKYNI